MLAGTTNVLYIIENLWDLFMIPINSLFSYNLPFFDNINISLGIFICGLIGIIYTFINVFSTIKVLRGGE